MTHFYDIRPDMFTIWGHSTLGENNYHIVLSKQPWTLAPQAPKIGVDSCIEEVLEWFNYPCVSAHPGYEVSSQGLPNQLASLPVLCYLTSSD